MRDTTTWIGALGPLALVFCLPACAMYNPQRATLAQLQARSAFDLGCPAYSLQLYHFDERTKGVVGCGRRLTYVETCEQLSDGATCSWLLDSPPPVPTSATASWTAATPAPMSPPPAALPPSSPPPSPNVANQPPSGAFDPGF
jgi:hypothetical protein